MTSIAHRLTAVAASVGLVAGGTSLVSGPVAAEVPISCAVVGEAGVIALVFDDPVASDESTVYENVGMIDEQPIGMRATVTALDGAAVTFEPSEDDAARLTLRRTDEGTPNAAEAPSASVTWDFYASGDPEMPVPVLSSWTIADLSAGRTSLSMPKNDLHAIHTVTAEAVSIDATADPVMIVGTAPEPSVVQLDVARASSFTITYRLEGATSDAEFVHAADGKYAFDEPTICVGVADHDDDGTPDITDPDDDNDGLSDLVEGDADTDGDGVPDAKDLDADNDGISDVTEQPGGSPPADADQDGLPNHLDLDADGDGISDATEAGHGARSMDGASATEEMIPGPYGMNGMADAVETSDATDATLSTENYALLDNDGGTVDFLENADLELVSITSASAAPGEEATITMSVRNNGIGDAGDVTLAHSLPSGTSFDPAASPGCSTVDTEVRCIIDGPIADGATRSVSFVLDTSPSVAPSVGVTTAHIVAHSTPDSDSTNNETAATFEFLAPMADIEITSVSSTNVSPGNATATIEYRSNGPSDSQGFELRHPLPAGATLDSAGTSTGCVAVENEVICTVDGPLAPGSLGMAVLAFEIADVTESGVQDITVSVANQVPLDDDQSNDRTDATFDPTARAAADLAVAVAAVPTLQPGESGVVEISIINQGPVDSGSVDVTLTLPDGIIAAEDLGSCVLGDRVITCTIDTSLAVGSLAVVEFGVTRSQPVAAPVALASAGLANPSVADDNPANDHADAMFVLDLGGDADGDGIGDALELDPENTGLPVDTDRDGTPDYLDLDSDGDGLSDAVESDAVESDDGEPVDTDDDGIPDHRDLDSDGDGLFDAVESDDGEPVDTDDDSIADHRDLDADNDGVSDAVERGSTMTPADSDGDGTPDFQDIDADNDGFIDREEMVFGERSPDDDGDGIPNRNDPDVSGITGVIVDPFDQPITDAKVTITTADGTRLEATTDALGRYLFASTPAARLAPGVVSVQAELADGTTIAEETSVVPGLTAEQDFIADPGVLALTGSSHTVFNTALVLLSAGTLLVLFSGRRSRAGR